MRTTLTRAAALAAVLVVALPVAASADVSDHAVEANTTAVHLSAFENQVGSPILDVVGTDAFGSSDPMASASVEAIEALGTSIGEVRTASSEDGTQSRDPEEGDGCAVPVEATGLTLDAICAVASATAGAPDATADQAASATTQLTNVAVSGSLLAGALTTPLGDFVATAGDLLQEDAVDAYLAECNEIIASIDEEAQVTSTANDLLAMSPEELEPVEQEVSDTVQDADEDGYCAAVFNLTAHELTDEVLDVTSVADALADRDLVTITIDGATSEVAGTETSMGADAKQVFVNIAGPSLDFLDDVIVAIVDAIVAEIEEVAGGDEPLPVPGGSDVQAALDEIPLFGITDPLLTAVVSGGSASAQLDLADGATSGGGDEPNVSVEIAPGVVELLGGDPSDASVNLSAGESMTIAEGEPAESTVTVGALTVDDAATFEDTELVGSRATASATEVTLLAGVEGGVVLTLAESSAGVFAATSTASAPDPDPDPLPNTGGGAAAIAVLALGAAAVLWRRRD